MNQYDVFFSPPPDFLPAEAQENLSKLIEKLRQMLTSLDVNSPSELSAGAAECMERIGADTLTDENFERLGALLLFGVASTSFQKYLQSIENNSPAKEQIICSSEAMRQIAGASLVGGSHLIRHHKAKKAANSRHERTRAIKEKLPEMLKEINYHSMKQAAHILTPIIQKELGDDHLTEHAAMDTVYKWIRETHGK